MKKMSMGLAATLLSLACSARNVDGISAAPDGGTVVPDTGAVVPDAGALVPDAGAVVPDGGSSTGALDLAQIDRVCERLTVCGLAPRLSAGDCRLALGLLLSGPTVYYRRVVSGGNTTTSVYDFHNERPSLRVLNACVIAASTCGAMAACLDLVPRSTVSRSYCDGDVAVSCDNPRDPINERYCYRTDCAARASTCSGGESPRCGADDAATDVACAGNTLVLQGERIDCGAGARCTVNTETVPGTSDRNTQGSCAPTGQVCAVGLDRSRRCGGWVRYPALGAGSPLLVPEVLLTVDRPATGPCASEANQGATSCVGDASLFFCLGNTERTLSCATYGGTSCRAVMREGSPSVRGACQ